MSASIQPAQTNTILERILKEIPKGQALENAFLFAVLVDKEKQSWNLDFVSNITYEILLERGKEEFWSYLPEQLNYLNVRLRPAKEILKQEWSYFLDEIAKEKPLSRTWLQNATLEWKNENTLDITVRDQWAYSLLQKKNWALDMQRLILTKLQWQLNIELSYEENSKEDLMDLPEELEAMIFEAVSVKTENETEILFGEVPDGSIEPIKEITEEDENIHIEGLVLSIEKRIIKETRLLYILEVTDKMDSITLKLFTRGDDNLDRLEKGSWIKAYGDVRYDTFQKELVFACKGISLAKEKIREDLAEEKRVELHLHTKMSAMDAVGDVGAMIARAAKWGHPAIAITDHGVVQSFPEAYQHSKKHGIKVIYGMEGYLLEEENSKPYHIILLVKNMTGLHNLYRLVSLAHLEYFHRVPRITRKILEEHREGLIVGSACEAGEIIQAILRDVPDEELLKRASFYDYLEIQPLANNGFLVEQKTVASVEGLKDINHKVVKLGKILKKPVVATSDAHFLDPEDEIFRRILLAGQGYKDAERDTPLFLRTTDEMLEEMSYLGTDAYDIVVTNPQNIASQVENIKPVPDGLFAPVIPDADEQIRLMTEKKAKKLYGDPLPSLVRERIDQELSAIIDNGYGGIYLLSQKLVEKSLQDGYLVGSRGSVGSSLVATLTEITEVNPLPPHYYCPNCQFSEFISDGSYGSGFDLPDKDCPKCSNTLKKDGHNIPFATFMGFEGDKVPDIDLNFSGEYQGEIHKYTEELLGKKSVFRAGTISTIAERTAFGFVKGYLSERDMVVRSAEMNRLIQGCTGVKRTTGQHPGGLMVVPAEYDVHEFTPMQRPADDKSSETITTHFDYHAISSRLLKLDLLGHDDPTAIRMLEDLTGINAREIPFNDQKTLDLFSGVGSLGVTEAEIGSKVGTLAIPEFGTRFVRGMLCDTQPKNFSELVRISGLSHGTDVWLNNAQELIKDNTCSLSEVISTRDDIMTFLLLKGMEPSKAFHIMEKVRKGKGLAPEDEQAMKEVDTPEWYIASCKKIKYLFPKAHAIAYVMMGYRIAYFKIHYPAAFYATYFTVRADDFDILLVKQGLEHVRERIKEIETKGNEASAKEKSMLTILEVVVEMYVRGLTFKDISLEDSQATAFKIVGENLLPPFAAIPGLGSKAAENIVRAREDGPFSSREDLQKRARLSRSVIELLAQSGAITHLPDTDQMTLF